MMAKKIKTVGEMREELGVAPTPTARYRLLAGRHARFRAGEYESFAAGDVVDLTPSEALRMASRIEAVAEDAAAEQSPAPPEPVESKKARRRREKRRVAALVAREIAGGEVDPEMCACGHAREAHREASGGPFIGEGPYRAGCWLCLCAGYQPLAAPEAGR